MKYTSKKKGPKSNPSMCPAPGPPQPILDDCIYSIQELIRDTKVSYHGIMRLVREEKLIGLRTPSGWRFVGRTVKACFAKARAGKYNES